VGGEEKIHEHVALEMEVIWFSCLFHSGLYWRATKTLMPGSCLSQLQKQYIWPGRKVT